MDYENRLMDEALTVALNREIAEFAGYANLALHESYNRETHCVELRGLKKLIERITFLLSQAGFVIESFVDSMTKSLNEHEASLAGGLEFASVRIRC